MSTLTADPTIHRQVVTAARHLLADDETVPVGEIARRAGVSRATFYRHFGSRGALLAAIDREPPRDARTRILEATLSALATRSFADLSMDELARAADVSRSTLYRLFPGRPALFTALIQEYSPFEMVLTQLDARRGEAPDTLLPDVAGMLVAFAERRRGLLRIFFEEVTQATPTAMAGARPVLEPALGTLAGYLAEQMAAGRLRPMHPLLALQAFVGPIYFHVMTRPVADALFGLPPPSEAVQEIVASILDGLRASSRD
jgi:AcrR family transcriptional regulator